MLDRFDYKEYNTILDLLTKGRENLTFSDMHHHRDISRFFLLRHDIDYSLESALQMAQHEAERGIRATYFLLLSSENYNLLSGEASLFPRKLIELGHEVGLHYDVQALQKRSMSKIDLSNQLAWEIGILSNLTGSPILSIAMHNPSIYGDDPFIHTNDYINAYDPAFSQEIDYFSDSCGAWRDHAYNAFNNNNLPEKLQILIHPFLWDEKPGSRWDRLEAWTSKKQQTLQQQKELICNAWNQHAGVHEHEQRDKLST